MYDVDVFFNIFKGYFTDQRLPTNVSLSSLANPCFQNSPPKNISSWDVFLYYRPK